MFKLLAAGIGFGAGFQAWRNYPPDGPVSGDMLAVVLVAGLVAAYLGGRWSGRGYGGATAVAVASAEATATAAAQNTVNVFTVVPGGGASPVGVSFPGDTAPWLTGEERPALSVDDLDGMDLTELAVEHEHAYDQDGSW